MNFDCTVPGCPHPARAAQRCEGHYRRVQRGRGTLPADAPLLRTRPRGGAA